MPTIMIQIESSTLALSGGRYTVRQEGIVERAQAFVKEFKGYGFFSYAGDPAEEREVVNRIVQEVSNRGEWPEDWSLLGDERDFYWFDTEWMGDLEHMYEEFLGALSKLSRGDFQPGNVKEFVDFDGDSQAWVEFDWKGDRHRITLKSMGDYIDYPDVVHYLNDVLESSGNAHRFVAPSDTGDQTEALTYLTDDAIQKLKASKGWSIREI